MRLPEDLGSNCFLGVVFGAFLLALAGTATAESARAAVDQQTGAPYQLILCGRSGQFNLNVSYRAKTMLEVPGGLVKHSVRYDTRDYLWIDSSGEHGPKLYFSVTEDTPIGLETSIRLWLSEGREATIHLRVVDSLPVADNVLLYHQSEREKLGLANAPNPCEPQPHDIDRLIARAAERHDRTAVARALPVVEQVSKSGNAPHMSLLLAEWEHDNMVVDFEALNPDVQLSRLTGIEVFDRLGNPVAAELLYPRASKGAELATVDGHGRLSGSILLPGAAARDIGSMEFRFRGVLGASPYFVAVQVVRFRPITDAETERGMRDRQMAISVRALGGGYWMAIENNIVATQGVAGTPMIGLGVRVSKGMTHNFAFEIEAIGGRSGNATFAGAQWQGNTGTISRQAAFGRVLGAGVIRFGDRYVGSMRLGVGVQLANYDSTFDAGANVMEGPGDGIEVDGVWTVGSGFDIRLDEHWNVGMGAMFAGTFYTGARSLDAGIQLGYRWGRSTEE